MLWPATGMTAPSFARSWWMNVRKNVGVVHVLGAPDPRQDLALGQDAALVLHEQPKQLELLRRQVNPLAVDRHQVRNEVEPDRPSLQQRRHALVRLAAKPHADARLDLVHVERLRHVIVGPSLERLDLPPVVTDGADHDQVRIARGSSVGGTPRYPEMSGRTRSRRITSGSNSLIAATAASPSSTPRTE